MCQWMLIMGCAEASAALAPLLGPFLGIVFVGCVGGVVVMCEEAYVDCYKAEWKPVCPF